MVGVGSSGRGHYPALVLQQAQRLVVAAQVEFDTKI